MTDPQTNSIRGTDHKTLSDLFAKVDEVSSKMADMTALAANVEQIAFDIRKFVGAIAAPDGWNGIIDAIGAKTSETDYMSVTGRLRVIMTELVQLGLLTSAGNSVRSSISTTHGNYLETLTVNAQSQLYQLGLHTELATLLNSILRQDGELPLDTSIFRLLASIDTNVAQIENCVCDGTTDPGAYEPVTPTTSCVGEASIWQECQLLPFDSSGTTEYTVYRVIFPGSLTSVPALGDVNFHNTLPDPALSHLSNSYGSGIEYTICIQWDFSPADTIYNYDVTVKQASDPNQFQGFISSSNAVPNQAGESIALQPYIDGTDQYGVQMNIAFTGTTAPVGKVFVTAVEMIAS